MKTKQSYLPGVASSLAIAIVATLIEPLLPIHLVAASVMALFMGLLSDSYLACVP